MRVRLVYTDYLVDLIARAEAASVRLAGARPDALATALTQARRESALLSARLDGSPLSDRTAEAVDARMLPGPLGLSLAPAESDRGSWARTLRLEGLPTQDVAAVEYANLLACFDAEDAVAADFFDHPREALRALHGLLCSRLVAPDAIARPRGTAQAVHDGAEGRMIYRAPAPEAVPALLDDLVGWLGRQTALMPTLVVAGVVHERLLEWQPFEAANGRLARAVSRVVLRARGLDPHGLSVPERRFSADPIGYYGEVAATARRGDMGLWLERYSEAVLDGLESAAAIVDPRPSPRAPARAIATVQDLAAGTTVTTPEYAERAGTSLDTARTDLRALARAGLIDADPCTRGLRYRVRG
ncbi:MAG: Fic family protein [Egibacteraceae bacterium]